MPEQPAKKGEKPATAAAGKQAALDQDVFARQEDLFTAASAEKPER